MKFSLRALLILVTLAACILGVVVFVNVPGEVAEIRGLTVLKEKNRVDLNVVFDESANQKTVWQLFSFISERGRIDFYDAQHPQISDPGAYVTIERFHGGSDYNKEFVVRFANHGWSSDWFPVSRREAVEYLWACRDGNSTERTHEMLASGMHFKVIPPPLDENGKRLKDKVRKTNEDRDYKSAVFLRERIQSTE